MSLKLTVAYDLAVTCHDQDVFINGMKIGPQDFCELVMYYMKNTDIELCDHRRELKERIEALILVEGFNGPHTRRFDG